MWNLRAGVLLCCLCRVFCASYHRTEPHTNKTPSIMLSVCCVRYWLIQAPDNTQNTVELYYTIYTTLTHMYYERILRCLNLHCRSRAPSSCGMLLGFVSLCFMFASLCALFPTGFSKKTIWPPNRFSILPRYICIAK